MFISQNKQFAKIIRTSGMAKKFLYSRFVKKNHIFRTY